MIRRLLSACLGAAALVGVLGVPARAAAKPPDLPMNQTDTVTPQIAPMRAHPLLADVNDEVSEPQGVRFQSTRVDYKPSKLVQDAAAEELPSGWRMYDALPAAAPTPTLYQLRPTARRTLAGSLLFGFNPLLAMLPTDKALDAPDDHPQRVAGDDIFSDMPKHVVAECGGIWSKPIIVEGIDWFKWLTNRWAVRHAAPAPEQNEGYINGIHPVTTIAAVTAVDAPAEIDAPLVPTAEALPMPKEDKPHKKKHKKHHPKRDRLPMPQEDESDGVTCPYLRQQAADRHACQIADPQIGRDVLDNLESLQAADKLLEMAEEFARAGCFGEAIECCAFAQDLCPGSPCANRAACVMFDLYVRACDPAAIAEEATEESWESGTERRILELLNNSEDLRLIEAEWERIWIGEPASPRAREKKHGDLEAVEAPPRVSSKTEPGVEQQVNGLMKACRLLVNEGLHEQAAELARQAFAMDPERVMADPLIYKMQLLATTPAPSGSSESAELPSCPYCPKAGKPIHGIVPDKKKTDSGPTTFLVPVLPPVDYEVVPALDRVLTETAKITAGAEEVSEEDTASSLDELIETIVGGPGQTTFGFGLNGDGSLRVSGEHTCCGTVYHVLFSRGCLAIWKTPDAAKLKP